MYEWLSSLSLIWGKIIAVLFFIGMIIWALVRPHNFIFQGAPDQKKWRDLRIWASAALGIQIIIYLIF